MGRTATLGGGGGRLRIKSEQSRIDDEFDVSQDTCGVCGVEARWCDGCQDMICICSPCDCAPQTGIKHRWSKVYPG